jgi:hypothetical protein
MFHKSFLNILQGKDSLESLYIPELRKTNFENFPKTTKSVLSISPFLLQTIKKEQTLITTKSNYYVACDIKTNVIYICFKDLLMIDIDHCDLNISELISHFEKFESDSFTIFSNNSGKYHVFCTSKEYNHREADTVSFMLDNYCDFYYSVFAYIRGFSARLNSKFESESTYTEVCSVNPQNSKQNLQELVCLYSKLSKKYKPSMIYPVLP